MPARALAGLVAMLFLSSASWTPEAGPSLLTDHLLVTWYGNPRSTRMGILGELDGDARAAALKAQAGAYETLTSKKILMAYHLVTVVAQCTPGADGKWRRRETSDVVQRMLDEARANGFRLILDIQPGRSTVGEEVDAFERFLDEPDVDLALDPEFAVGDCEVPGQTIGSLAASDVNTAIDKLESIIKTHRLPPKILIVHQFRFDMLPDKKKIRSSDAVDVVLDMDGFGGQALKLSSYRAVMRQPLAFAGIKLFYRQDTNLFSPEQIMKLKPVPSVVVYQ